VTFIHHKHSYTANNNHKKCETHTKQSVTIDIDHNERLAPDSYDTVLAQQVLYAQQATVTQCTVMPQIDVYFNGVASDMHLSSVSK